MVKKASASFCQNQCVAFTLRFGSLTNKVPFIAQFCIWLNLSRQSISLPTLQSTEVVLSIGMSSKDTIDSVSLEVLHFPASTLCFTNDDIALDDKLFKAFSVCFSSPHFGKG